MKLRDIAGDRDARGFHIGVAVSRFNAAVTEGLEQGALRALEDMGVERVTILRVAGALELPLAARRLAEAGCDAVVAVGAVIQGETDHYHHVATQSAAGISAVSFETGIPVTNAVLTVRKLEHALHRSGPGPGNKGYEAAESAVTTLRALRGLVVD